MAINEKGPGFGGINGDETKLGRDGMVGEEFEGWIGLGEAEIIDGRMCFLGDDAEKLGGANVVYGMPTKRVFSPRSSRHSVFLIIST